MRQPFRWYLWLLAAALLLGVWVGYATAAHTLYQYTYIMIQDAKFPSCRDMMKAQGATDVDDVQRCTWFRFRLQDGNEWELNLKPDRPVLKQKRRARS